MTDGYWQITENICQEKICFFLSCYLIPVALNVEFDGGRKIKQFPNNSNWLFCIVAL